MTAERNVKDIDSGTLKAWLDEGQALLIDVRPADMLAGERIAGAASMPLVSLELSALPDLAGRRLVFQCQRGIASEKAGRKMLEQGLTLEVHHLTGGILAWKGAGFKVQDGTGATVTKSATTGLSIQRQVQVTSGALVLLGVVLGATLSPWFLVLAGFVGAGMLFAGATGSCGMASLFVRLPFNRDTPN